MRSGFLKKLDAAFIAFVVSTVALASCSGADNGYSPPEVPAGAETVPQSQSVNGVPSEQTAPVQQGVPQQAGAPPQDGGSLGAAIPSEPAPDQAGPPQEPLPADQQPSPGTITSANGVASASHCAAEALPGTYTTILAQGHINGTTFTAVGSGVSVWDRSSYVAAKRAAPKSPASLAHSAYIYTGTYTVNNAKAKIDTVGCVTLVATQNGANIKASKFSAQSTGSPFFTKPAHGTFVASGPVIKLTITGLSKSGGSGTFVLSNKFTGTIHLTSRTTVP